MALPRAIKMVDLHGQYLSMKNEIDNAIQTVIEGSQFINGEEVGAFRVNLGEYLGADHVITCANGTDALQIALMALNLPRETEVIVPTFNYVAAAETAGLLGLRPVFTDVDPGTFNITAANIERQITERTRVIIVVHLLSLIHI